MNIFLAPRSNETSYKNFVSTIENGIDYSIVEPHLNEAGRQVLNETEKLFVWGTKESKKTSWDKMEVGDVVLFYKGREDSEKEGKFLYAGRLLYKQHSRDMGLALWPPKPGEEPWTCIFFLTDLKPIYMPLSEMIDFAGYSKTYVVQGFMPLNEEGVKNILEKFGSLDSFIDSYSKTGPIEEAADIQVENEITAHKEAEFLLLKAGVLLGYDTYSPDKSGAAYGEDLGDYITLKQMPTRFIGDEVKGLVSMIDVLWFKDGVPVYAFEVEHSTKFGTGFQRMFQLEPVAKKLFIISAAKNYYLYEKFISADPYYKHKAKFAFKDYKQLEKYFNAVTEFEKINETFLG